MSEFNRIALANVRNNTDPITQEEVAEMIEKVEDVIGSEPKNLGEYYVKLHDKTALGLLGHLASEASPHVKEWLRQQGLQWKED